MNHIKILIITALISLACLPEVHAQNIDDDRMNRDIHIMDNVLQELFKTQWTANGKIAHVSSDTFSFGFGSSNDINGTYLSDYGVIFTVPAHSLSYLVVHSDDDNDAGYTFQYGDEGSKKITKEAIVNRIKDFLQNYGSTIGQLKNDDRITVIYKAGNSSSTPAIYAFSGKGSVKKAQEHTLPSTIIVTAKEMDLQAFRKGSISKDQFDKQLNISTIDDEGSHHQDVKVMANIFKTSFEDVENDDYKISGAVNHIYIDNLGALFYLDASYGSGFYAITNAVRGIQLKLAKMPHLDSVLTQIVHLDTVSGHLVKGTPVQGKVAHSYQVSSLGAGRDDKSQTELKKEKAKAYHQFLDQLKQTMVDYGRTLRSVKSDEQVYVSVSLSDSNDDLPNQVGLQIKKSTLEALDKGSISRSQAMQQITVREN